MKTRVRANITINLIRTIAMTILSFITFPYVCRVLGATALGQYSWATAFVYYFLILARISIPNIAVRECTKVKDDPEKLSQKVSEFFVIQAITTLLSFGLMCAIMFMVPSIKDNASLIFIVSINFLAGVLSFEWLYTALEKHTYMAFRSIFIAMLIDILVILFVKKPGEEYVYLYAFLCISTTILTVISNLIFLPSIFKYKPTGKLNFKQYLPLLGTLLCISLVGAIYDKTDTFILGFIDPSKAAVGSYSVSMKGVEIVIGLITSLSTVFIPRATYYLKNDKRQYLNLNKYSFNICLIITIPAVALMIALAEPITCLISGNYGAEATGFTDIETILIALASLMVTYSLSSIINTQILIPQKKEKYFLFTMAGGALLNILLSLLFSMIIMKDHPGIGVAIGTSITDALILITLLSLTWADSKSLILNINNIKIVSLGTLIGVVGFIVSPMIKNSFLPQFGYELTYVLEILIVVLSGAVIYFIGLFLLKEKLLMSRKHKVVTSK